MHTDPELLALLALGEQVGTEDEHRHVRTCAVCSAELNELTRVAAMVRGADVLTDPSPRVWAAVRQEVRAAIHDPAREVARAARPVFAQDLRAHARLQPVQTSWSLATGVAELATDERGRRLLQVTLDADLPHDGVRQAWLVHRDDPQRRQTLGILDGLNGLWTVEHAIDLDEFGILDISQQHVGSTEHSGQTIVRGELVRAA